MSEQATKPSSSIELERVTEAARDSLTDDMVARLAETTSSAVDLLDKFNRSGLGNAIPALARMVHDGDLERLVQLARLYGSAQDAMTDEMVGRLSDTVGSGLDLLDQVNRSNLSGALPVVSNMIADGDLERIAQLARLVGSAQDAMTDEMVSRLAETFAEGVSILDRLNRCGIAHLVTVMERMEANGSLERLGHALVEATDDMEKGKPATGGFGSLWRLVSDREHQEVMRFLFAFGRRMRVSN